MHENLLTFLHSSTAAAIVVEWIGWYGMLYDLMLSCYVYRHRVTYIKSFNSLIHNLILITELRSKTGGCLGLAYPYRSTTPQTHILLKWICVNYIKLQNIYINFYIYELWNLKGIQSKFFKLQRVGLLFLSYV